MAATVRLDAAAATCANRATSKPPLLLLLLLLLQQHTTVARPNDVPHAYATTTESNPYIMTQ